MFDWAKRTMGQIRVARRDTDDAVDSMLITGSSGFISGTHVVSNLGWRAVEELRVGDKVLSFDNGMQPIADIQRDVCHISDSMLYTVECPVLVPQGALRNRRPLWLMPEQGLLVESDMVMDDTGDPFAVVPAKALAGHRGIDLSSPAKEFVVTTLGFHQDEIIYVEGGMLAHCPAPRAVTDAIDMSLQTYHLMNLKAAKFLIACHMDDDEPVGLTYHPEEIAAVLQSRERPNRTV